MPNRPSAPVGLYLGVVQFLFALCWTIYVIYLPALAAQVGIAPGMVIYILMLDQLVFIASDYAMGVMSDRMSRLVGRLGLVVLGVTVVSCLAFLLLPLAAGTGSPALFLALTLAWSISSSALRAPPLTLVGRHASQPARPGLVALSMLGLGVAGALGPYLGMSLRGIDPRLPFALSSVALALATLGIVAAERALRGAAARTPAAVPAREAALPPVPQAAAFVLVALLAALAFQVHVFFNSAPLYLRHAGAEQLPWLLPVFWVGFNLGLWPASVATRHQGALRVMGVSALVAGAGTALLAAAPQLTSLVVLQALVGAAWAGVLMSGFSLALDLGHTGHEGRLAGALSSVLALAALLRLGTASGGWQQDAGLRWLLSWTPTLAWLLAGGLLWALWLAWGRRRAAPA